MADGHSKVYMFTVLVLTTVFADVTNSVILFSAILFAIAILLLGLLLFYMGTRKKSQEVTIMMTIQVCAGILLAGIIGILFINFLEYRDKKRSLK